MMEHLGQHLQQVSTARYALGGAGTQASALAFGGEITPPITTATEEWTGAGAGVNKNNYSKLTGGKYGNKNIHRS
jgi:hypothetical protein